MALTESTMVKLGSVAPYFNLPDTLGKNVSIEDFDSELLIIVFTCNHCPYAKAVEDRLIKLGKEYKNDVDFVLISSNDSENYPEDSPKKMAERHTEKGYPFPYLFDETQEVAKNYQAACTPDFYLFDKNLELYYRGRFDSSRPGNNLPVTGEDIHEAAELMLSKLSYNQKQYPSMGCNIKWND